jgi:F-type H+-transporting ATPase subunit b
VYEDEQVQNRRERIIMMPKRLCFFVPLIALLPLLWPVQVRAAEEHGATTSAVEANHASAGEHEELMPPLMRGTTFASAIWVIAIFLIVLAILYPTAWKNVMAGLRAREQKIRNDIAEAEATRSKAEATLREYNTQLASAEQRVREMIASATVDGERVAAQIRTRAESEAQEARERATKEIETAKKQAIAEIYEEAATLATNVAEKILRRNLNPQDQRDLVTRSLDQVQNLKNN